MGGCAAAPSGDNTAPINRGAPRRGPAGPAPAAGWRLASPVAASCCPAPSVRVASRRVTTREAILASAWRLPSAGPQSSLRAARTANLVVAVLGVRRGRMTDDKESGWASRATHEPRGGWPTLDSAGAPRGTERLTQRAAQGSGWARVGCRSEAPIKVLLFPSTPAPAGPGRALRVALCPPLWSESLHS